MNRGAGGLDRLLERLENQSSEMKQAYTACLIEACERLTLEAAEVVVKHDLFAGEGLQLTAESTVRLGQLIEASHALRDRLAGQHRNAAAVERDSPTAVTT
jgi:hypothetical protein